MNKEDKGVNHRNIHENINSKGMKVRRQILVVKRRRAISVSRENKSRNKYRKGENPMSSRLAVGKKTGRQRTVSCLYAPDNNPRRRRQYETSV